MYRSQNMIVGIPGINGLGHTSGVEKTPKVLGNRLENEKVTQISLTSNNIEEQQKEISIQTSKLLEKKEPIIIIGGDHSISFPIGKSFLDYCKKERKEPALIIFDAHADCMPPMKEPTHEEWLRALIESGFPSNEIILIGTRVLDPEEERFLDKEDVTIVSVSDIKNNMERVYEIIKEKISGKELYISFDVDVFDSSIVKATGYPSQNGLKEAEIQSLLMNIIRNNKPRIFDLVEVNLEKRDAGNTLVVALNVLNIVKPQPSSASP